MGPCEIHRVTPGEMRVAEFDKDFVRLLIDTLREVPQSERRDGLIMDVVSLAAFPPIFICDPKSTEVSG